jgi:hypothetical protein
MSDSNERAPEATGEPPGPPDKDPQRLRRGDGQQLDGLLQHDIRARAI